MDLFFFVENPFEIVTPIPRSLQHQIGIADREACKVKPHFLFIFRSPLLKLQSGIFYY